MAIYSLDETPDVFICPAFYNDKFHYRMEQLKGDEDSTTLRIIDLRSDELIVHGVVIKESMFDKLYDSLILRPTKGAIAVNSNGACYVLIAGKCYRPIHDVIFDWSPFGIIVPNSTNDSLRKQLDQQEKEIVDMKRQLSHVEDELKASRKETEDLKEQLSTCKKSQQEMEVNLQKVCDQLSCIGFELEIYKIELESSKKEERKLHDELCTYMDDNENIMMELEKIRHQLPKAESELQATITELELSKKRIIELEEQLLICNKEKQNKEAELQKMEDKLSLMKNELQCTKSQLESLEKSTNRKLDQMLTSMLWTGADRCQISQPIRLQGTRCEDSLLTSKEMDTSIYTLPIIQELPDSINSLPILSTSEEDTRLAVDYTQDA